MSRTLEIPGWDHLYSGKVRDLFVRADEPDRVLVVASDRVSAYDHILSTEIPDKGKILTALSLWWFERLADEITLDGRPVTNHVLSLDVPAQVAGRAMICERLTMVPVECVARGYLTGSGLADYSANGSVCGNALPPGLVDGDRLEQAIFTPATKAELGEHDENVSLATVAATVGEERARQLCEVTLTIYETARQIAERCSIILADTKFEFGTRPGSEELVLADEVLTPDSSRFWPAESWQPGRAQPSFDKQIVRDWLTGDESGWSRSSDIPPPPLPAEVVERTRDRYLDAYRRLTGHNWQ